MKVKISTDLACPAIDAWQTVIQSATLSYVALPLAKIEASRASFPKNWIQAQTIYCKSYLFGFIPVGERTIYFERVDSAEKEIQSRESDPLIRRWDHLITVKPTSKSSCTYCDEVVIEAGLMTFFVWAWANWFYRHRQKRLADLVLGKVLGKL